jgi:hypothetical protein
MKKTYLKIFKYFITAEIFIYFMHNNVVSPRSMNVVFKKIGFAIQKGLAAQLVAHLPFTHVLLLYINRKCKTHKFFFQYL